MEHANCNSRVWSTLVCLFWFELRTTISRPIIRVTTQNRTLPSEGTYHYDGVESKKESNLPFSQHRKQINHSDMSHLVNKLDQPHRVKKQCTSNLLQVIPLAINASRKFVDNNVYMSARQYYACILFFFVEGKYSKKCWRFNWNTMARCLYWIIIGLQKGRLHPVHVCVMNLFV